MITGEFSPEFAAHMHPREWGGHDITRLRPISGDLMPRDNRSIQFARRILEREGATLDWLPPLEERALGDAFSVDEFKPGSIVLLKHNSMRQAEKPFDLLPPGRQTEPTLEPHLGPGKGRPLTLWENGIRINKAVHWGVVALNQQETRVLIGFSALTTQRDGQGNMIVKTSSPLRQSFVIGEAVSYVTRNDKQAIWKPELLHVYRTGRDEAVRSKGAANAMIEWLAKVHRKFRPL